MQTFPNMRRSSINTNYTSVVLFSIFLVFYQIMSSLYLFLPLFVGIFFVYLVLNYQKEDKAVFVYLSFIYLCLYDLNKGFYLFSSILFFIIFYNLFVEKIKNFFTCSSCILVVYIVGAYIGHYFLNVFIAYLLNQTPPLFSTDYFYYIVVDSILAITIFKAEI